MSTGTNCPKCRADEHRLIAHVQLDYVQWWTCQACGHEWVRWPKTHPFYPLALKMMREASGTKTGVAL